MDKNFDHKIRDILNDPPEFPFDEKAWDKLAKRMHRQPDKKWRALPFLVPLALLMWLVPFVFSWSVHEKLGKANAKIERLESLLETQATLAIDTVARRYETVVYDTIYRTTYVEVKKEKTSIDHSPSYFSRPPVSAFYQPQYNLLIGQQSAQALPLFSTPTTSSPIWGMRNRDNLASRELGNMPLDQTVKLAVPNRLDQLGIKPLGYEVDPSLSVVSTPSQLNKNKKGLRYYTQKLQPTNFALAGNYGLVGVARFNKRNGVNSIVGLQAAVGYGKNLHLVLGADYLQWAFKQEMEEDDDDEHGGKFPEVSPDLPSDKLHEIYGDFRYAQIPIGLKYTFSSDRKICPSIGFGVAARKAMRSQLAYDFLSTSKEYKIYLNDVLPNAFELKSAWGSLGLQYRWTNHWQLLLDGTAQIDFEKGEFKYESLQLFMLRGGVQYSF